MFCFDDSNDMLSPGVSASISETAQSPHTNITTPDIAGTPMVRRGSRESSKERNRVSLHLAVENARRQPLAAKPSTAPVQYQNKRTAKRVSKAKKTQDGQYCAICDVILSGNHEFDRHVELVHQDGWRWQVIDPSEKNLFPIYPIGVPIADCRKCSSGKIYGPNYNTAAHLRRCHFANLGQGNGSRAGSSGGSEPDIRYLEFAYMKLVEVRQISAATSTEKPVFERTGREIATPFRSPGTKKKGASASKTSRTDEERFYDCYGWPPLQPILDYPVSAEEYASAGLITAGDAMMDWTGTGAPHKPSDNFPAAQFDAV
ncbi:hypothetical protein NLG97_g2787 [Lecanicillium saksenae]|uniref:Uncharacterized protein n=1 Tax=Lecanicillium saksenae TaxID=468837 RepID=A0ACC1R1U0_9HYPO|nr:hypothetical protein NLG97_g2787 [Lecanicillium saksenae]